MPMRRCARALRSGDSRLRNTVFESLVAAATLAVCALLLVRLALGERRRAAFDRSARRTIEALRRAGRAAIDWPRARRRSAREADEAIRRARGGHWDGNVYRPKSFRRPRKPPH